jgi:succinoglycan biosynthesis transport protein ExoP
MTNSRRNFRTLWERIKLPQETEAITRFDPTLQPYTQALPPASTPSSDASISAVPELDPVGAGSEASLSYSRTLADYLAVLRRRRLAIVLCTVCLTALAVGLSFLQAKRYSATALVVLSEQNLAATVTGNSSAAPDLQRIVQTDVTIASSEQVAAQALKLAGVNESPRSLLASEAVNSGLNSDVLSFTVTDATVPGAIRLANAYAKAFTNYQQQLTTTPIALAETAITKRIAALRHSHTPIPPTLITRQGDLGVLQALQASNATLGPQATSAVQTRPKPELDGAIGLVVGLLAGIGFAFMADALDTRTSSDDEIAERLGRPIIARLPEPEKKLRKTVVSLAAPSGVDAEAYRLLRANLTYALVLSPARRIMIMSALESEGKSTVASNLAVTLARSGSRVALVDFDLRRPTIEGFFKVPPLQPGVTDVLLGSAELADAMSAIDLDYSDALEGASSLGVQPATGALDVLVGGMAPPSVGDLLSSGRVRSLLDELDEIYDFVLIDSAPALKVGDAATLAASVDGVVAVVRLGRTTRKVLDHFHQLLRNIGKPVLGVVVTGSEGLPGYGYRYYYGGGKAATRGRSPGGQTKAPAVTSDSVT